MSAPREKVFKKFISAHQKRAQMMNLQYHESLGKLSNTYSEATEARQYHQSMLVSLIEACKGINELYNGITIDSSNTAMQKDLIQSANEFYQIIQSILQDYSKSLIKGFNKFFSIYFAHFANERDNSNIIEYSTLEEEEIALIQQEFNIASATSTESSTDKENGDLTRNRFTLQEERSSWLLLARQSILDVKYLDSAFLDTCSMLQNLLGDKSSLKIEKKESFYSSFSQGILAEIQKHNKDVKKLIIRSFVRNILLWIPKIAVVLETPPSSTAPQLSNENRTNSFSSLSQTNNTSEENTTHSNPGASSIPKSFLHKKFQAIQSILKLMSIHSSETFSECARYIKPLIEIYEVINLNPVALCRCLTTEFSFLLSQEAERACGLSRHQENNISNFQKANQRRSVEEEEDNSIFEVSEFEVKSENLDSSDAELSSSRKKNNSLLKKNALLYMATVLKYCLGKLPTIFDEELSSHDFPPIDDLSDEKVRFLC
jgi:hypothetical protein